MLRKLREGATTLVSWEKSPKKEGTYPKREIDTETLQKNTDRLQKSVVDYKSRSETTKFTNGLQNTTRTIHILQSLLIE
jgi:hypothetical protein